MFFTNDKAIIDHDVAEILYQSLTEAPAEAIHAIIMIITREA